MGCGLPKLEKAEENSPGKIYSTLKRPQVETKVGTAYCYSFLDFIIGKDDIPGSSALCLPSLRELPAQLQDLYQQGFVLAAVHAFIHPSGVEEGTVHAQLYRAVLVKLADSSENSQLNNEPQRLEMDMCLSSDQLPGAELIQGYMKKIQDSAEQGVIFVGFIQQCGSPLNSSDQEDSREQSPSLHSSPVWETADNRQNGSPDSEAMPEEDKTCGEEQELGEIASDSIQGRKSCEVQQSKGSPPPSREDKGETEAVNSGGNGSVGECKEDSSHPPSGGPEGHPVDDSSQHKVTDDVTKSHAVIHNNNKEKGEGGEVKLTDQTQSRKGVQTYALFNHPHAGQNSLKFYSVKVPLKILKKDNSVCSVEANWLDHMTQHFTSGASLVDGYFHLGADNDSLSKSVEGVFIFQDCSEGDSSEAQAYDAIVVEQWTVFEGIEVKTDYIPLLRSLAMYGWRLTCVLPTPIVKTNSEGNLATKQIVFLQRPCLPRKKKESKKLSFKTRSKSNKTSIKDVLKNKKHNRIPKLAEKIIEDVEKEGEEEQEKSIEKEENSSENNHNEKQNERDKQGEMDTEHSKEPRAVTEEQLTAVQDSGEKDRGLAKPACVSEVSMSIQETGSSVSPPESCVSLESLEIPSSDCVESNDS
ncbi:raftlin [Lepisosteus oculatus]|uniref:raftlin n=1 Tax=Lepisosteus oculatus TaxID=7918 RepID=UPI0035F52327